MQKDMKHRAFLHNQHGFTGGERALLIAFALAIVALVGALLGRGSSAAAADAARVLGNGQGQVGSMQAAGPVGMMAPRAATPVKGPSPAKPVGNPVLVARSLLGDTEYKLQPSGTLDMDGWVPKSEDCANFVSGCLEKAGEITHAQRSDAVIQLAANLRAAGWKDITLANAKPGDVVCFDGPDGNYQHVELFNGWVNGKPQFIGSNNILPDGTQEISYDSGTWAYRFHVLSPP